MFKVQKLLDAITIFIKPLHYAKIDISCIRLLLCQWVRYYQDGTAEYIEGATNPEYVVTADDVDKLIAVECIPMDDQNRQVLCKNLLFIVYNDF
ncbi:hypothetical protein HanHA300_Chr11g0414741 [Helianthus annuus]|nr:hypothetical protein HanHA300_Chr11g0414741 [Helianthus annuus]